MSKAIVIKDADFSANKLTTVVFSGSIPCTALALNKNSIAFTALGTDTLSATPTPVNTTDSVSWLSSDTSVATVANGVVTAQGAGSAVITATCGNQTATCSVSVVLAPSFVLVAGYNPQRRSNVSTAATLEKQTSGDTNNNHVLAANSSDTSKYPIESKDNIDTGSWYFIPIELPTGATGFTIDCEEYEIKTRILWFDNTRKETLNNKGAYVLYGLNTGFDQGDWSHTQVITVPDVNGINSYGGEVYLKNSNNTNGTDYASEITLTYSYT